MPLFFYLLTNDHFQGNFLNKLYILSTFSNISLPFHEIHLIESRSQRTLLNHEKFFDVNQNLLARALKIHFHNLLFFLRFPHRTTKEFLVFIKAAVRTFVILSHVLYSVLIHWLIFKDEQISLLAK